MNEQLLRKIAERNGLQIEKCASGTGGYELNGILSSFDMIEDILDEFLGIDDYPGFASHSYTTYSIKLGKDLSTIPIAA